MVRQEVPGWVFSCIQLLENEMLQLRQEEEDRLVLERAHESRVGNTLLFLIQGACRSSKPGLVCLFTVIATFCSGSCWVGCLWEVYLPNVIELPQRPSMGIA